MTERRIPRFLNGAGKRGVDRVRTIRKLSRFCYNDLVNTTKLQRPSLVFSGGGALGAYQAGVFHYIATRIIPEMDDPGFDYIAGTSIGAVTGAIAAAFSHAPGEGSERLNARWRSLDISEVLPIRLLNLWRLYRSAGKQRAALADPTALTNIILRDIPWLKKRRNLAAGHYHGLAVTATRIRDGRTVVFHESNPQQQLPWNDAPNVESVPGPIGARHLLASSALPLLFPPARIGQRAYSDGGIRFNTPLSPVLRLGGRRIFLVEHKNKIQTYASREDREGSVYNPVYLLGKLLQAVLTERTEHERAMAEMFNRILQQGEAVFGRQFVEQFSAITEQIRGIPIVGINLTVIQPSEDLNAIAAAVAQKLLAGRKLNYKLRKLLGWLATDTDSELLGMLLFDGMFCGELVALGIDDARTVHDELLHTLCDPLPGEAATPEKE